MLQPDEKKKVTKSINDLGRRVTAADVSTKTGLPVLLVSQALNQIAAETNGRMAVSQNGDLIYSFALGFSNAYLARGAAHLIEKASEKTVQLAFTVLKISFGIMLMLSFFIILFFFYLILYAQKPPRSGKRGQPGSTAITHHVLDLVILRQALFALANPSRKPIKYDYNRPTTRRPEKSNFLLDCFSLLFGDGDPNEGLEEKRWQLIAKVIKQHDNVITADQMAPYTGEDPKNEDWMLPILVRFNGKPEVTESGNIIYTFPSLAVTAGAENTESAPAYLTEFPLKFTETTQEALKPIYTVAGLNFVGAWFFYLALPSKNLLFTSLTIYGTLFVVVPYLRYLLLGIINKRIEKRNEQRAAWAQRLCEPDQELKHKIAESREFRMRGERIAINDVVYTTAKPNLEQEDALSLQFKAALAKPGDVIDAKPEETFDASPSPIRE